MLLVNENCQISITIDDTYTLDSVDNKNYDIILNPFHMERSDMYKVFAIDIDLKYKIYNIALVGEFYSLEEDCAILEDNIITILQNDTIVQLNVHNGELLFYKELDTYMPNFGIYKVKEGYILYGELLITMLDEDFNIVWKFGGKDIFVSYTRRNAFQMCDSMIKLYDFEDNYYEIDYEGKQIKFEEGTTK